MDPYIIYNLPILKFDIYPGHSGDNQFGDFSQESDGASAGPSASEVIQHIKEGKSPLNAASLWALSTSLPPIYLPSVMSDPLNNDLSFDNPVVSILDCLKENS